MSKLIISIQIKTKTSVKSLNCGLYLLLLFVGFDVIFYISNLENHMLKEFAIDHRLDKGMFCFFPSFFLEQKFG
jgi:hypothetical protein